MYSMGASMVSCTTRVMASASARFCSGVRPSRMLHWMMGISARLLSGTRETTPAAGRRRARRAAPGSRKQATAHLDPAQQLVQLERLAEQGHHLGELQLAGMGVRAHHHHGEALAPLVPG